MKTGYGLLTLCLLLLLPLAVRGEGVMRISGSVRDAETGAMLSGVELWTADNQAFSDAAGRFVLTTAGSQLIARLPGYRPLSVAVDASMKITLQPFVPKALYLSFWGASRPDKRRQILGLITHTQLNALVIDVKSSRGYIAYRSHIPLAGQIGAQQVRPLKDLPEFLAELKDRGIYSIARIVVFKDDLLARQRPELAAHDSDGRLWQDREKLAWSDPFSSRVRDYNLAVAEEVAGLGFDEIQFDYTRFPARSDLRFSRPTTDENRVAVINLFLSQAKQRLASYPVQTSVNIFGYICWKHRDGKIGQRLVDLGERVDYLSPMLYPSGFSRGIPGHTDPVKNPYAVIAASLQKAQQLSGLAPERFRPWLQAFRDYAFDRRSFSAEEIHAQINASDALGSNGWMLWNAASRFSLAGIRQTLEFTERKLADVAPKAVKAAILTQADGPVFLPPAL